MHFLLRGLSCQAFPVLAECHLLPHSAVSSEHHKVQELGKKEGKAAEQRAVSSSRTSSKGKVCKNEDEDQEKQAGNK